MRARRHPLVGPTSCSRRGRGTATSSRRSNSIGASPRGERLHLQSRLRRDRDHDDPADRVVRPGTEDRPEDGQVVRHEERRDGDRHDVVEHERDGSDLRENFIGSESVPHGPKDRGWIDAGLFGSLLLAD